MFNAYKYQLNTGWPNNVEEVDNFLKEGKEKRGLLMVVLEASIVQLTSSLKLFKKMGGSAIADMIKDANTDIGSEVNALCNIDITMEGWEQQKRDFLRSPVEE